MVVFVHEKVRTVTKNKYYIRLGAHYTLGDWGTTNDYYAYAV